MTASPKTSLKHPRLRAGLRLAIPVGGETVHKHLSPQATHVALSLQTADGAEGKRRHDQVTTYLAGTWAALRRTAPVSLMNLQVTALAGGALPRLGGRRGKQGRAYPRRRSQARWRGQAEGEGWQHLGPYDPQHGGGGRTGFR